MNRLCIRCHTRPAAFGLFCNECVTPAMRREAESVDITTIPEVKALVDAVSALLDTARGEYENTDWTVDQWLADEPTVAALDAALDPFRVPQ